jgi:NAD(P)-dependent dehydrogenase (short-subunit alcohol dehydrogenase family)
MQDGQTELNGKVVLVTGAAKRIGRGIALRLAREGARVAIHYGTSEVEARRTAEECGGAPLFRANLESVAEIERLFADVEQAMGGLYGLVNNAARFANIDPIEITEADWDFIHDVNLKAVFFCCREAAKRMRKSGGGRIVNISSLGGIRPWAMHAHYCASKAGVIMLTRALAKAFAPQITVNSVAPGVIPFEDIDEEGLRMIRRTPAARGGTPAEIAGAVVYFLTASNFVTGQLLAVDGGLSQV